MFPILPDFLSLRLDQFSGRTSIHHIKEILLVEPCFRLVTKRCIEGSSSYVVAEFSIALKFGFSKPLVNRRFMGESWMESRVLQNIRSLIPRQRAFM